MSRTKPIPVRLSDDDISRLDEAAERMGTNRAALIRFCADTFARYVIKVGKAALPLNWQEILNFNDGRTREARDAVRHAVSLNEDAVSVHCA